MGGWAYRRVDVKLRKDFPAMRRTRIAASLDIFNVFNYMNFTNYPFIVNNGTWFVGQPSQVLSDPRRIQLGVEYTF